MWLLRLLSSSTFFYYVYFHRIVVGLLLLGAQNGFSSGWLRSYGSFDCSAAVLKFLPHPQNCGFRESSFRFSFLFLFGALQIMAALALPPEGYCWIVRNLSESSTIKLPHCFRVTEFAKSFLLWCNSNCFVCTDMKRHVHFVSLSTCRQHSSGLPSTTTSDL
jgi:hypothetical protein